MRPETQAALAAARRNAGREPTMVSAALAVQVEILETLERIEALSLRILEPPPPVDPLGDETTRSPSGKATIDGEVPPGNPSGRARTRRRKGV
ncbi:hypothetical protein [Zavarzinia sp.]|jgi:hypothetical protein|uniref:hypothetical protein n=1 Tax=Zavarzinia sp. TaxID=2027920 RepID=UPI00356B2622